MKSCRLLLIFFIGFFAQPVKAQQPYGNWGCYDSLLVSPGAYCIPDYDPVCACNDTTYRNFCYARNAGFQQYVTGICEAMDFNIRVNPVYYSLELDIILREEGAVNLYIMDWFGKVHYQNFFNNITRRNLFIDVTNFNQGIYIIVVSNNEGNVVKKFVKADI